MSTNTHITLIGFMGSGKSSVAKRLSAALNLPLIETDALVCERTGCSHMADVFAKGGEELLRHTERLLIEDFTHLPPCVISTGGGMVLNPLFKEHRGYCIYLYAAFEEITRRLRGDLSRPIRPTQTLYESRLPLYEQYADLTIDTNWQSVETVTQSILERLCHGL